MLGNNAQLRTAKLSLGIALFFLLAAPTLAQKYQTTILNSTPHVAAQPKFFGEACAEMQLRRLRPKFTQNFVFDKSDVDPSEGRGCTVQELKTSLERIGFSVGQVWYRVAVNSARADVEQQFDAMYGDLRHGVPSIVSMRESDRNAQAHFRLVLGYDAESDEVIYHEPAQEDGGFLRMDREKLLRLWPLKDATNTWTVARMPLKADESDLNFLEPTGGLTDADYAQHVMKLQKVLPPEFHVVVQKPFVIIGNELKGEVEKRANETVKWAVERLKLMYFEKDPEHIVNIWIFKDKTSYDNYIMKFYKHEPKSPFGYYSPAHRAIFTNISTGTGTLVHEIVHPFMLCNFPKCPTWFNEGLASLYEQSNDRDGRMVAQTNQRLKQIHQAIAQRKMTPIKTLTEMKTPDDFYAGDKIFNYAQARFLCYYLEKQDLLQKFYHEFRLNVDDDPTGFATLQRVLGEDDMGKFQRKWEYWLLTRRY